MVDGGSHTISYLCKKYIKGTEKKAIVQLVRVFLCGLTNAVLGGISFPSNRVYINTRVVKHVYDKKPAEEFDFLVNNTHLIVKYPDKIYKNRDGKRGEYCFVKDIKNQKYFCSIEIIQKGNSPQLEVVTFYRIEEDYLKNYELLWEWKGGNLHRSAFDAELPQPNSTPQ